MSVVNSNISIDDLAEIESRPSTRLHQIYDWTIIAAPIISILILQINYYLLPNFGMNETTHLYSGLIGVFGLILVVRLLLGIRNKKRRVKNRQQAPFYTIVFLMLTLYDFLSLKTGTLALPYFPWPDMILNAAISERTILLDSVYSSMKLLFLGYFFGVLAGLITGISAGWSPKVNYWVQPVVKVIGPIPATTWLPILFLLASSLFSGSVFLIALGVWYPVTMTTMVGISSVRKNYFEVARTLGADQKRLIFKVAIPAASTNIFTGLTQGMGIACTTLIIAEMMGVESGLGWYMTWQSGWAEFAKMYAALIIICLTFTLVNTILSMIKKRALRWQEGTVK